MIRSYYRCCCINAPVISSQCVHLKLGHGGFHALLKVCSDNDDTVSLSNYNICLLWFCKIVMKLNRHRVWIVLLLQVPIFLCMHGDSWQEANIQTKMQAGLKRQYRPGQSRLSTGHWIGVLVSLRWTQYDWKLLAHVCSSNSNIMTFSCGVLFSVTELI